MIEEIVEAGYYPADLVLLQETSITLTELDNMDPERKWTYIYYIMAAKKKELREQEELRRDMEGASNPSGGSAHTIEFPDDFVSVLDTRAEKERLAKAERDKRGEKP